MIFERFFNFLRPAFSHGRLGHPHSLEYLIQFFLRPVFSRGWTNPRPWSVLSTLICSIVCLSNHSDFLYATQLEGNCETHYRGEGFLITNKLLITSYSLVICHMSLATSHLPLFTCHFSLFFCHLSLITNL